MGRGILIIVLAVMMLATMPAAITAPLASATPYSFYTYQAYQWPGGVFVGAGTTPASLKAYSVPASMGCELALTAAWNMSSNFVANNKFYSATGGLVGEKNNAASSCANPTPVKLNGTTASLTATVTSGTTSGPDRLAFNAHYTCLSPNIYLNGSTVDVYGNSYMRQIIDNGGYTSISEQIGYEWFQSMAPADNRLCRDATGNLPFSPSVPIAKSGDLSGRVMWAYPLNSSAGHVSGAVVAPVGQNIFVCRSNTAYSTYTIVAGFLNLGTGAMDWFSQESGNCDMGTSNTSGAIFSDGERLDFDLYNLTPDTPYQLIFAVQWDHSYPYTWFTTVNEPSVELNISTAYAAWECSAWSSCFDGQQSRDCVDTLGYFQPKTEARNCSFDLPGVAQSAALGFELGRTVGVTTCRPGIGWLGDCVMKNTPDLLYNFTVEWPANWVITPNQNTYTHSPYFAQLTSEWAATGSRSLKMWRIPSANFEPGWSNELSTMSCINSSLTLNPSALNDFSNDTMRAYYDVTFPSEFMTVGFTARACPEPQERTPAMGNILGSCARTCYGNCTAANPGTFRYAVIDNETAAILMEKYLTVGDAAASYVWQLPAVDITRTYRMVFSPYSDNPADNRGNCVMFDAVTYNVTASAIENIAGGECVPYCDGINFYSVIPGDTCGYVIEYASPKCLDADDATKAAARADFCIGTALYSFSNATGAWQSLASSPVCVAEENAANITTGTFELFESDNPLSGFNFLFSPLFIAFIANLLLSILPTIGFLNYADGNMQDAAFIFALLFGAVALMFSFVGLYPAILGLLFVLLAGLIIAASIRQAMAGG